MEGDRTTQVDKFYIAFDIEWTVVRKRLMRPEFGDRIGLDAAE